jgi:hypothetical protein
MIHLRIRISPVGEAQQPDRAEEPVKRAMLPFEKAALAVPAVSEQGAGTGAAGTPIIGLTPLLLSSVAPSGMMPPLPAVAPGKTDGVVVPDAVAPTGAQLLKMPEGLADGVPPMEPTPPPSKVEVPANPVAVPNDPAVQLMVPKDRPGAGLTPPGTSSVAPMGMPTGPTGPEAKGDVAPMPRGEVAPMPEPMGAVETCAKPGPPLATIKRSGIAAVTMKGVSPVARMHVLLMSKTYPRRARSPSHLCSLV